MLAEFLAAMDIFVDILDGAQTLRNVRKVQYTLASKLALGATLIAAQGDRQGQGRELHLLLQVV